MEIKVNWILLILGILGLVAYSSEAMSIYYKNIHLLVVSSLFILWGAISDYWGDKLNDQTQTN